ncbi:hypothetical protein B0I72DRAFT_141535 [Yarrowia lipolytica]|jgi:hypothetical protein|uniref:YALI0C05907p n=2 Tax=Yarrowia lipolytica TaxID=4952 RepID=Q6CCW8_YARLI|nr:YALI0C05907p [Yarrowia lipolytica CLIB122]AOW02399.1 hypothetical protein YALI1_C07592g [Yarrowia lipolytica]KAB8283134.1 hypothetical protein BKA91DRAFT_137192 [Yarrowia lipolytica]KAE8173947.1 hypothetical protein BKA90DRAFT_134926 [Yarrowia lipolytica]KAJ8053110.1 hypothetical protein LXG23DRAFT_23679 [Yarrowia lipolytica]RDW23777.1 hypothetical protein B0I71DRAFT_135376 [Yarrowia lipolytica]|eukprot:XP_501494.1 YALI0C05907p [Yarrowia lipolytica CLIB122]
MSYSQVPVNPPLETVELGEINRTQQDYHPGEHLRSQRHIWTRINALEHQIEFLGGQLREAKEAMNPKGQKTTYSESTAYGILSVIALMCSIIPGFFVAMDLSDGPATLMCMGQICLICFIVLFTTLPFAHKDRHIFRIFTAIVYLVLLGWETYVDLWAGLIHAATMVLTVVFYMLDAREARIREMTESEVDTVV